MIRRMGLPPNVAKLCKEASIWLRSLRPRFTLPN